ncbi:HNH endonuclease [Bowdeniella massiliensis]|uniref:HNH endonuclease n=1 Tax=Bowdeniella massiliensis TaxID=2932264 RepID=UPI003D6CD5C0
MASSRTGTSTWIKVSKQALRLARTQGLIRCPICGVELNWSQSRTPSSPEADHLVPYALGGSDTLDNLQVICRRCNQSKGARSAPKPRVVQDHAPLVTSRRW